MPDEVSVVRAIRLYTERRLPKATKTNCQDQAANGTKTHFHENDAVGTYCCFDQLDKIGNAKKKLAKCLTVVGKNLCLGYEFQALGWKGAFPIFWGSHVSF